MRVITARELRARLGEALDRASAGERLLIERDHRPLAVLVSPEDAARLDESAATRADRGRAVLGRLAAFRERMAEERGRHPSPTGEVRQDAAWVVRQERDAGHGEDG